MGSRGTGRDITTVMRAIRREAERGHGVPPETTRRASAITVRRLGQIADPTSEAGVARLQAYFWGVVRREALASPGPEAPLRDRYLVAALAEDMEAGGHSRESVYDELVRQFGSRVPPAVLDTFRHASPRLMPVN